MISEAIKYVYNGNINAITVYCNAGRNVKTCKHDIICNLKQYWFNAGGERKLEDRYPMLAYAVENFHATNSNRA